MKKILFLALAMMCSLSNVFAQSWTSGQPVGAGTFYFYNIGAQRYLGRGTKYTTHAVLDGAGLKITVAQMGNGGSLYTGVNGKYLYFNDVNEVYVDGGATEFVCEAVNVDGYTNAYKLKSDVNGTTHYLGWTGEGNVETSSEVITTTTDPSNDKNFCWLLIRPQDRTFDVTNLITNPDFEYFNPWISGDNNNNQNYTTQYNECQGFGGWEKTYNTQSDPYDRFKKHISTTSFTSGIFCEAWVWPGNKLGAEYIKQTITIPTAGSYTLTVTGQAVNQQTGNACSKGVKLYLKQGNNTVSTIIGAAGSHTVTMNNVTAGSLELGVEIEQDNDANWVAFDNVRLYYHSDAAATYTPTDYANSNTLTFIGAGWLDRKTFNMKDYTFIVGNPNVDAERAYVQNNDGFGTYVIDRNGYQFTGYDDNTKLPIGYGTYYTFIPKTDGILTLKVKAIDGGDTTTPLVFVDASGNIDEIIPYSELKNGFTSVDCGFLEKGKVYYLYSRRYAKILINETKFTTVPEHVSALGVVSGYTGGWKLVEENDFDQYGDNPGGNVWVNNGGQCTTAIEGGVHGICTLTAHDQGGARSMLYPFENLESRQRYVIEFDAKVEAVSYDAEIALYRTNPGNNSGASDYLLKINTGHGYSDHTTTEYKFYVYGQSEPVLTASLKRGEWYHYIIDVNGRDGKIGIKVTSEDPNEQPYYIGGSRDTYSMTSFTGDYIIKGLSFFGGRKGNYGKFDNIAIFSNQGSIGSVSTPQIELTGVNGTKRTVTVTGGVSDLNFNVTTYYNYITVDNSYNTTWDAILNAESWKSWTTTNMADIAPADQPFTSIELPEFDPDSRTTYIIRAISTIHDYATVLSDTAYLRVVAGEPWALTGGFEVVAMTQEADGYYTPTLRAYANTGILPANTNVTKTITYRPLDYGNRTERPTEPLSLTWSYPENNNSVMYSEPFVVPRSSDFILHLSATGFTDGEHTRRFYKDKYKVTYSTPDFASVTNPVNDFATFDANFDGVSGVYGYSKWNRQVSSKDGQINIWQTVAPITVPGWATTTENDFLWYGTAGKTTATMNSIICARSAGSDQSYSFRTNQSTTTNALILKVGYGLVKNANTAWNYRCGMAHIGECNEIPEFIYDTEKGNGHALHYAYPNPYKTNSNVPECNYSVPAYAALKQYRVFTPVETKVVPASGLATYSSYYAVYNVSDFFMNNDELIDVYRSPKRQGWGRTYYLHIANYCQQRQGFLIAANEYANKDIWTTYTDFMASNNGAGAWNGESKKVELRIIPDVPRGEFWSGTNELISALVDGDGTAYDATNSDTYVEIQGSSTGDATGRTNLILHKGTSPNYTDTNGEKIEYMNFFCLPTAASKARLLNKSAYLEMEATYEAYQNAHSSSNGIKVHLGDEDEYDDSALAIDEVENQAEGKNDGVFYTITGQKVSNPTKGGVYIHNGMKVLVK